MKLSEWAKKQGITYRTAFQWVKDDKMPCRVERMPSGTIIVHENIELEKNKNVVIYTRVSSYERKDCLQTQINRCTEFALNNGFVVEKTFKEIASGMNDNRKIFWKMIDSNPSNILVENKDRLTRFGFNYLKKLLYKLGINIIVINESEENEHELMKDFIAVMTSFCCRLYGLRRGTNKVKKIKEEISKID